MSEVEAIRRENDILRAIVANNAEDCVYCGLPASDMAKCALGFPGCSRADDLMGAPPRTQVFTPEQVLHLNNYQNAGTMHPFTCGSGHRTEHPDGEGLLVATIYGWVCPYCDYRQNWAHEWMKTFKSKEQTVNEHNL